ncbi:MAG: MFS transporter [Hyphomonadaceae bacterium]
MSNGYGAGGDRSSAFSGWYIVGLLTVLYMFSFLDRLIVLLLVEPLKADLHLADTQIGLLYGLGFGLVYTLAGLPLAHWIDRGRRIPIVVGGVLVWSASTVASAFANSFEMLLACRSGVAIGEAVLSPAAISLIADLFKREKRVLPTAIYVSTGAWMSSGAFVFGGATLALSTSLGPELGIAPWRLTFMLVGAPGILLGLLLLLSAKEPARRDSPPGAAAAGATNRELFAYIASGGRLWGYLFVIMTLQSIGNNAMAAWTATILIRSYHVAASEAGLLYGAAGVIGAVVGIIAWPWIATRWVKRGRKDAYLILLGAAIALIFSCIMTIGVYPPLFVVLGAVGLASFGLGAIAALPVMTIQAVSPPRMRARLAAGNLLAQGLVGAGLGSWLTAFLSEEVFQGPFALGNSLITIAISFLPFILLFVYLARPWYVAAWDESLRQEHD